MSDCLDALYQCRSNHGGSEAMNVSQEPSTVCALRIAQQFAAKAANRLSQHQFHQLLRFLRGSAHGKVQDMEFLEQCLARKLEQFHSTEVGLSGEGRDRLARPGGLADASLGLILHVQCEDDVLASSCTRDNLRKCLPKTATPLEIELAAPTSVLGFDLDFRTDGTLRRIILHVPHPTAGFFTSRKRRESMAAQIDAGMNFILWLIGKDYSHTSFVYRYLGSRPRCVHIAPLPELWCYVRKEAVEGKRLRLEEYSPSFLSWVCRYIGHDPALVLATGASLARTAAKKIVSRIHKRSTTTSASKPIKVTKTGGSGNQESKERSQKASCPEECQQQSSVVILREHVCQGIQPDLAKIDGDFRETNLAAVLGKVRPQHALNSVKDESTRDSINTSAAHSRNRSPSVLHRPLVDEIDIPKPLDDSHEDNDEDQGLPIERETGSDEAGEPKTCHGTTVQVYKNGRVVISSAEFPLEFRTSNTQAQKIYSFGSTLRIYFSPTDIEIRVNKEVVYTKPIERLLGSLQGAEWLSQLILEKQASPGAPYGDEYAEAKYHSGLGLVSHERHGSTYKNGELKRKLLQSANFHCAQLKSRGAHTENRVVFRGVQLTVPLKANTQTVSIQVDLVPEGTVHPHECIDGGEAGDPAHRLSIQVRYRTMHENAQEEFWYRTSAQGNIKKLNSLVDFLENKDRDWTAQQSRRFLDRNCSRKRFKTSYTD
ncbi:MAG: hypothetical protein Q9225_004450 [Loekoesia sp. 1 TL-2023]